MQINCSFTRKINSKTTTNPGCFVISFRLIANKRDRRRLHNKWFKIKSNFGVIYRVIKFSPTFTGSEKETTQEILLDWSGWLILNGYQEDNHKALDLKISKSKIWDVLGIIYSHPDPTYRLASWLGLISVILGGISLFIALI